LTAATARQAGYDVAVVGAGIVGLACALAAARARKRVIVIDRDAQANGASVRNFGFITVTGQQSGACWRRALRSRDVWAEIAPRAGIEIVNGGLNVVARRSEARAVLEAFAATPMGAQCSLEDTVTARKRFPELGGDFAAVLHSPHELRVESRDALPKLGAWMEAKLGVTFLRATAVTAAVPPFIQTSRGAIAADAAIVCPGDDFASLYADRLATYGLTRCKLQMLRVAPPAGFRLCASVMTDLSLVRYLGYAELPAAAPLRARLEAEQPEHLAWGIHLIAVQSADGTLVVGDTHEYAPTPDPFLDEGADQLVLDEYRAVFAHEPVVTQRWCGTYASASDRLMLVDAPSPHVRVVVVTSGTGASTSFAIGEDVVADLFGTE
jgi:FAD dependent oxidoreductase TIGR03364